jgi:DNA (cytosine-5)-methyltransferase 1
MSVEKCSQGSGTLNVVELFAGVGGFRLGLEAVHGNPYAVTLSNQFEPSTKAQHASTIYRTRWPTGVHLNEDIVDVLVSEDGCNAIRRAAPDVVVGGFPCQDYSVAKPLSKSRGLAGEKGVLWWSTAELLRQRIEDGQPVKYLILENVDRLLASPAICRGRDFAVILSTLHSLSYAAEWRVVNAADYGCAQRRRRIFIVAYHRTTAVHAQCEQRIRASDNESPIQQSILSSAFPCIPDRPLDGICPALTVQPEPFDEQLSYRPLSNGKSRFGNSGLMVNGSVWTYDVKASPVDDYSEFTGNSKPLTLGDVVGKTGIVPTEYYVRPEDHARWEAAKGAKKIARTTKEGFAYDYTEGAMSFPDPLNRPSRTVITSEGGTTPSRTKHVIRASDGRLRRLTPEELERLNGFPVGHTALPNISDITRAKLMGNALVVPLVRRIGESLLHSHTKCAGLECSAERQRSTSA